MTIAEFISQNLEVLKAVGRNRILAKDVDMLGMFNEAQQLIASGNKVEWVAANMSEKYSISQRQFYSVMKRLRKTIL